MNPKTAWEACYRYCVQRRKQLSGVRPRSAPKVGDPAYYTSTKMHVLGMFCAIVIPDNSVMELILRIFRTDGSRKTYSHLHRFHFGTESLVLERMDIC
jgi:hypothetical protein